MGTDVGDDLKSLINTLVDERCGIIKNLYEKAIEPDEPQVFIFNAQCCSPIFLNHKWERNVSDVHATGCDWSREQALWSTIGEAMERYSTHCWPQFHLETKSSREMGSRSIDLEKLVYFSEQQYSSDRFRWEKLNENTPLEWHNGINLHNQETVAIPANLIWVDYFVKKREQNFYPQVSTGLACGPNRSHVVHGGLREVIERDAFACHWGLAASPPRIDFNDKLLQSLDPNIAELLTNQHFDITVCWVTTDIDVPCIFTLMRSKHHEGTTVGGACHPNAAIAIEKSVTEATHGWRWLNDLRRDSTPITDKHQVKDFKSHVRFYISDDHFDNLSHYYRGDLFDIPQKYFDNASQPEQVANILDSLENLGYHAYYTDITPEDIASLGFEVGKVIIPGLQPLASGYNNEHFDTKRLDKFAAWKGLDTYTLNYEPHPFP